MNPQIQIQPVERVGLSREEVLQRIDVIIQELEALRKIVVTSQVEPVQTNLAQQLFGSLGQGSWEEYTPDLDWQRFEP